MELVSDTYASVFAMTRPDEYGTETQDKYQTNKVKIKPGKPTQSGEATVMMLFPFSDKYGEERTVVLTLGADLIEASNKVVTRLDDLEARFPVLSENNPLRRFCKRIEEELDLAVLWPRNTDDAALGAVDLLVPGFINGVEFDIIVTIGLHRTDWIWYNETKLWIEYPISEEKMAVLEDYIIPYSIRSRLILLLPGDNGPASSRSVG